MPVDHTYIDALSSQVGQEVTLKGWLYNKRGGKGIFFLILRDGSGLAQCVVSEEDVDASSWQAASDATQESAVAVTGNVRADERQIGGFEVQASSVSLISKAEEYPITPKEHGVEFLMNQRHLWLRSRKQWAVMKVRNRIIYSMHQFFQEQGFVQMDAPILTGNAVEGTSTLFEIDYFGRPAYLTQSGQLHGEAMAMAMGKIYTFGPTFRAEKSKTRRHLTEFWMIEPEMAFFDLDDNMELAEGLLVRLVGDVLRDCQTELEILERDQEPLKRVQGPFPRISYDRAVDILHSDETADMMDARMESLREEDAALDIELADNKKRYGQAKKWEKRKMDAREIEIHKRKADIEEDLRNLPNWKESARTFEWGTDFGGSDETVITWHFDRPIIVHRFPHQFKAFYMKRDPEDDRLALGMDVLAPEGYGEIVGGGERATDLEFLQAQVKAHGLPEEVFDWYFDLRKFGSVPHSGFGIGLERTVSWICGLHHLREAIPFPRLLDRIHP
ncbi:MAG: asparagine--tRNA ligase [Rhodothermales bacterium]|nr:asparagine--tRNA ligase [Rhodothermales bacterium]MBO6780159.1 asparagine--tRNA ligase [Rhodothermales bacterium]